MCFRVTENSAIEFAMPSDQNYFPGLLVTAYSLAKHAKADAALSFNILDGGITDDSFSLLRESVCKVHANSSFRRFKINEQDFSAFPDWKGNKMTYVRYLLPTFLKDCPFVIYADSDCLWLADVAEIWNRRDKDVILQGVYDRIGEKNERPWFETRGLRFSGNRYFCNGLLLMNLDLFREEDIIEKCTTFIKNHPDVQYADQSAFNHIIGSRVTLLPDLFNFFTREIFQNVVHTPAVLHYANDIPWRDQYMPTFFLPPYKHMWFQYYAEALGEDMDVVCRRYGYRHNNTLQKVLLYVLPRDWARHIIFGMLIVCRKRQIVDTLRHYTRRCGKIVSC